MHKLFDEFWTKTLMQVELYVKDELLSAKILETVVKLNILHS